MRVTTPRCCTIAQVFGWQWPLETQCFDDEHIIDDGSLLKTINQVARHQLYWPSLADHKGLATRMGSYAKKSLGWRDVMTLNTNDQWVVAVGEKTSQASWCRMVRILRLRREEKELHIVR